MSLKPDSSSHPNSSWAKIIQAASTPIGFLALVALILHALALGVAAFLPENQRIWLMLAVLGVLIFSIGGVLWLTKSTTSDGDASFFTVILTPPDAFVGVDLHEVEWDLRQCLIVARDRKTKVSPSLSELSGAYEVRIPAAYVKGVPDTEPSLIKLVDMKGLRWEAGPFFPYQKTLKLISRFTSQDIAAHYGDEQ